MPQSTVIRPPKVMPFAPRREKRMAWEPRKPPPPPEPPPPVLVEYFAWVTHMRNRDYQIVSDAEGPLVSRSQALAEAWGERARTINNQAWLVRFAVNEAGR